MTSNNNKKATGKKDKDKQKVNQNQLDIKLALEGKLKSSAKSIRTCPVKQNSKNTPNCNTQSKQVGKKRSPTSPPEQNAPSKKLNMDPIVTHEESKENGETEGTGELLTTIPKPNQIQLSPELAFLRELISQDFDVKIEPLKVELASLVKSHKKLEEKGHEIDNIKIEN